MQRQPQKTEY